MQYPYSIKQHLVAYILLLSISLQGCKTPISTASAIETDVTLLADISTSSTNTSDTEVIILPEVSNLTEVYTSDASSSQVQLNHICVVDSPFESQIRSSDESYLTHETSLVDNTVDQVTKYFAGKTFVAKDGYRVAFQQQAGQIIAHVQPSWSVTNSQVRYVPVHIAPGMRLSQLLHLDELGQKYHIHVIFSKQNKQLPVAVYVGSIGLLGGGNGSCKYAPNDAVWVSSRGQWMCPEHNHVMDEPPRRKREREEAQRRREEEKREEEERQRKEAERRKEEARKREEERIRIDKEQEAAYNKRMAMYKQEEERRKEQIRFIEERRKKEEARRQEEERILLAELAQEKAQREAFEQMHFEKLQKEAEMQRINAIKQEEIRKQEEHIRLENERKEQEACMLAEQQEEMQSKEAMRLLAEKIKKREEDRKEEQRLLEEAYKKEQEAREEQQRLELEELCRKVAHEREVAHKHEEADKQEEAERIKQEEIASGLVKEKLTAQIQVLEQELEAVEQKLKQQEHKNATELLDQRADIAERKEILQKLEELMSIEAMTFEELEADILKESEIEFAKFISMN